MGTTLTWRLTSLRITSPGCLTAAPYPPPTRSGGGSGRSFWPTAGDSSPIAAHMTGQPNVEAGLRRCRSTRHDAEGRYLREPFHRRTPEHLFERTWAVTLLDGVLARLRAEYEDTGRGSVFEILKVVLVENPKASPHAELARRLGTTAGAAQVAVHRLRRRYRALVWEEIAATVADLADVEEEIRELFAALAD